jgi:iron complex outermembrane receptor protein
MKGIFGCSRLESFMGGILAAIPAALLMSPVHAQEGATGIGALMEEITVTARKREESIQDTPIAVSAFTGESLDARGIVRIDGIAALTPNMTFMNINTNGGGGSNASVYIRGVGQTDFVPSADPGVGLYVDGVYIARSIGSVLDLIDVERVEILRGPQGTLFGRNTIGGAMAIHTVKPHEEFEAKLRVKFGINDRMDFVGKVNGALADNVFASATIGRFDQDGYNVNPTTGQDTGDDNTLAFRGAIRWLVNEDIEINVTGDYSRDRENGQASVSSPDGNLAVLLAPGSGAFNHNFLTGPLGPPINNPGVEPFVRTRNTCDATPANIGGTNADCANASTIGLGTNNGTIPSYYDADIWGVSATVDWQVWDNISVKSITSYRELDSEFAHDGDNSPFELSWVRDYYNQSQFSQEIQLQGLAFDDRLQWIIGGYYFEEDGLNYNPVDFANIDIESGGYFDHSSKAVFAQGTFDLTDKLHITAGIRYTKDSKDFIVEDFTFNGTSGITVPGEFVVLQSAVPTFAPPGFRLRLVELGTYNLKASEWTPMGNVAYDWNDELMTYYTYSEGFKSGGVQQRIAGPVGFAPTYDPEFVVSHEVGFKYNSDSGNFTLNAAAFFVDYTDIQLETIDPNGGIAPQLKNAGDAEIKGFEFEARWTPIQSWFFEAAVGHLDAEITDADADATASGGPSRGDTVPHIPEWTASMSLIKEFALGDMGTVTPRIDYSYRTKVLFSPDNNPRNVQKSHGLANASVGWVSNDDKYSLNFYVNNIGDIRRIFYTDQSPSSSTQNDIVGREREWYISGEVRF